MRGLLPLFVVSITSYCPAADQIWASEPIADPPLPVVSDPQFMCNGIDAFILRKLDQEQVAPSREADRATLIRRVHLDITGLPPAPDQWRRWMAASGDGWYGELVDELLSSPHYGERWARFWLDQARFADSDGYEKDEPRPHIYHWRDWVIDALNNDLPFDQFTEQQIAGDLLPGAGESTRIATGFNRNTLTNREGGIDKEEDRVKQVVDRVNTVSTVWLGLSVKCAQCHTHKYDPITIDEYYQLYAFFNNADETDFPLEPTPAQRAAYAEAKGKHERVVAEVTANLERLMSELTVSLPALEEAWKESNPDGVPALPAEGLVMHWPMEEGELSADGVIGNALVLNGKGQRIEIDSPIAFDSDSAFTLSAWINRSSDSGAILTKMDEREGFRGIDFTMLKDGLLEVHLVDTWPSNAIKVTTKHHFGRDAWHHVLMQYDGSEKAAGVAVFVDGQRQELTISHDTLSGSFAIDEPWRVGSRKAGTYFGGRIDDVRVYDRVLTDAEIAQLANMRLADVLKLVQIPAEERTSEQQGALIDFAVDEREDGREWRSELAALEKNPPKLQRGTGMALARSESSRRTFVQKRGVFLDPGNEVQPATPGFLHPLRVRGTIPDRLDLARWIIDPANTFTARVTVNRIWQQYFGRGIVESDDDFGTQGALPSHPELLDWLATRFVQNGWSLKALHKLIVTSATYRQSSETRLELAERDPYNTWLASQNRQRVEAETVRDLALAVSGLLDPKVKGPSVFPPLPPGVIELAFVDVINRGKWNVSEGGDRYRRGLYTFFQRTAPYPMLSLFDAPESAVACTRREKSNTPLQALTLWNDPVFTEAARALGDRIVAETGVGASAEERIRHAYALCFSREPLPVELATLLKLKEKSAVLYGEDADLVKALFPDASDDGASTERASWFSVARTLLNLDEFITRE